MPRVLHAYFLVIVFSFSALAQQIEVTSDGQHILHLMPAQQVAVNAFLKLHPDLSLVNCPTTGPDASWCKTAYSNWQRTVEGQSAQPQFPSAAWGDFRGNGVIDFALAFHTMKAGNTPAGRHQELVVFENLGEDRYKPVIASTEPWGPCLDGLLFHPKRKQLEFWCNTAHGTAKWNGTMFVGKTLAGD